MKNLIILIVFMVVSQACYCQTDTLEHKTVFVELVGNIGLMSSFFEIDAGQKSAAFDFIKDPETKKPKRFNSSVDALNYMGAAGWKFEAVYSTSTTTIRYLFSKTQ